jgi:hypothetical protein
MINPNLKDWWSHKRLTNLRYKVADLGGDGVSMQVLAQAFTENEMTWFSIIYGEFNDNLMLLALDNQEAEKFNKTSYDDHDTKRTFFGSLLKNEFKITGDVAAELGLLVSDGEAKLSNKHKLLFTIFSHDNCFFYVEPVSDEVLKSIIQAILQQHSYYLGKEIEWKEVETLLIEIIKNNDEVSIQSDPKKRCVWISQIESKKGWFWKKFRQGTIIIDGGKAHFRDQ